MTQTILVPKSSNSSSEKTVKSFAASNHAGSFKQQISNKLYVVKEEGNDSSDSESPLKNKYGGLFDNNKTNKKLPNMKRL